MAYDYDIQNALEDIAEDHDIKVRSYSGRAMYGRECLGIVGRLS